MRSFFLIVGVLLACLVSGCSKKAEPAVKAPKTVSLGTIEFASGQAVKQDVGDGMTCQLTVTVLEPNALQVVAVLQKGDKQVATTRAVPVMPDRQLQMQLDNLTIEFAPHMK